MRYPPIVLIALAAILLVAGCAEKSLQGTSYAGLEDKQILIYKSPTCGCCGEWGAYMEDQGFDTRIVKVTDLSAIKERYGIPKNMESCHTAIVGDYFVEGHIPIEVVNRMLLEKPDIDGIMLPRMPSGSPGMPGPKTGEWIIYQLKDGNVSEYMRV